jgi:hypothetical protein
VSWPIRTTKENLKRGGWGLRKESLPARRGGKGGKEEGSRRLPESLVGPARVHVLEERESEEWSGYMFEDGGEERFHVKLNIGSMAHEAGRMRGTVNAGFVRKAGVNAVICGAERWTST